MAAPRHFRRHVRAVCADARSSRPECQACARLRSWRRSPFRPSSWRQLRRSSPVVRSVVSACTSNGPRLEQHLDIGRQRDVAGRIDRARDVVMLRTPAKAPSSRRPRLKKTRRGFRPSASAAASALATQAICRPAAVPGRRVRSRRAGSQAARRRPPRWTRFDRRRDASRRSTASVAFLLQPGGQTVSAAEAAGPRCEPAAPWGFAVRPASDTSPQSAGRPPAGAPVPRLPSYLRE